MLPTQHGIATPLATSPPPLWHIKFICFHITGICTPSAEVAFIAGHKKTKQRKKKKKPATQCSSYAACDNCNESILGALCVSVA